MTTKQIKDLNNFLAFTGTDQLGEGDTIPGANLLACAACTIANLAEPGSGIVSPEGLKIKVGSSLLINGAMSASLVREQVCSELTTMQNNWSAHLKRLLEDVKAQEAKPGMKSFNVPTGRSSNSENTLLRLQQADPLLWDSEEESWIEVIDSPPVPRLLDMTAAPKVIVTATGAASLKEQLVGLHRKRPLVIMGLNDKSASPELAATCASLMNGTLPDGIGVETVTGNVLLMDSDNRLAGLAEDSRKHDIAWLGNMPWLTDGAAGPEAEAKLSKDIKPIDQMPARINRALQFAMAGRLRNDQSDPVIYQEEFTAAQKRWILFLKDMENSLPGIVGSARQLLATLVFGMHEITHVPGFKKIHIHFSYIEAFAQLLIQRMANARNAIYIDAEALQRARLARALLARLKDGRQPPRDLYRSLGIRAELCHDILDDLARKNYVCKAGSDWSLTETAMQLLFAETTLPIEV